MAPRLTPVAAIALVAAVATAASGLALTAPTPAAAAAGTPLFLSSFEQADPQPQASTPWGDQTNISGSTFGKGSKLATVTKVDASAENAPGEVAANAADGSSSTKWLAFQSTGWLRYQLSGAQKIDSYTITSGGDAPERDPKNFTVQGSNDGSTWTDVDTRTNQTWSGRLVKNSYQLSAPVSYSWYRLNITANGSGNIIQLSDWDILDSTQQTPPATPMVTTVGNGPVSAYNIKPNAGFSGLKALRYGGSPVANGETTAQNVLFDKLNLTVGADTQLSYKILPVLDDALTYSATYAAIDLVFSDGSRLSKKGLLDANGFGASAREQGTSKALYASQWNSVKIDLKGLEGKVIDKILFAYDDPNGQSGHGFSGWVDDIALAPKVAVDGSSLVNWVDTRRGTLSSGGFSRGNNFPATAVPNGFNFFTPMTNANTDSWLYNYASDNTANNLPRLQGIGISHEPSPWMGDRNQLAVMPGTSATPSSTLTARQLEFSHGTEIARPDLYSVKFTNGMIAEVTPTDHGGVYRFAFTGNTGSVQLDKVASNSLSGLNVDAAGKVTGWVDGGSGLSAGRSRMFISGQFDKTPTGVGTSSGDRSASARYAAFDTSGTGDAKIVTLRIATSFISQAQAQKNLDLEVTGKSFDQVQQAAAAQWNTRLGVITIEGGTDVQNQNLYSNLYRLNLYPNSQFENTGTADAPKYQYASPVAPKVGDATATTTNAQIKDGKVYVNNGFWDTYRTVWPAYSLLYPQMEQELVDGFVQQYRDSGWVARWSSPGYADLMTGTSSDVAFADAYLNGALDTKTALEAYDAALKNATVLPTSSAVGRKGLDTSTFLGYTSASTGESVSWGLEGGTNDYGIGRMAAKLADDPATPESRRQTLKEESEYFLARSWSYVNLFDKDADFFQAKNADGSWHIPSDKFDPKSWGDAFTESDGWNFAFHAPFDIDGLAALYGGTAGLDAKLDQFFSTPEKADTPGGYGGVIHEMLEARDVRMGQLGMSNQVSHHIPYLYAAAGDPAKTQKVVREITQRLFVGSDIGQGYPGDEDNGETSAWYIFSALGFYPEAVGSGEYVIGSPIFTKATVHLANNKSLVINAPKNSEKNIYIQSATFNGSALNSAVIPTTTLSQGGTLDFDMGATPSDWGKRTSDQSARVPHVDATKTGFGTTKISDETDAAKLTDDNSRSSATFNSATPSIEWTSASGPVQLTSYTLTNGATGSTPTAWTLEGSSDGQTWLKLDERTGEKFAWATQTRPFVIPTGGASGGTGSKSAPAAYDHYRLHITATSDGKPATLAEIELLADPAAAAGEFALNAAPGVTGTVGATVTAPLATLSGGTSADAADYTATVDFKDGKAAQKATLTKAPLGGWQITAPHTFDKAGVYTAQVTVGEGMKQASTTATITITRDASFTGALDSVCIGDTPVGTTPGTAANCDTLGAGFIRAKLAANGFVQGTTVKVPNSDLTFDLPAIPAGQPDNVTGRGQTIAFDAGTGATSLSFIGTATEKNLSRTGGKVNYTDGSSDPLTIALGDWTAAATTPQFGNTIVAKSEGRTQGASNTDTAVAAIYATAPFTIPAGKTVASVTLPKEPGSAKPDGRLHIFAIASNGTRTAETAPLAATGSTVAGQTSGVEFTAALATATGGHAGASSTATVNWGDGTGTTAGTVTAGSSGGASIAGTHTYAAAGKYTVTVTVDDGIRSAATTTTVEVTDPVHYTPSIQVPASAKAGDSVTVTGSGFAAGEDVAVTLASTPAVTTTVKADGAGAISASITVPAKADTGTYPVTALGSVSAVEARADLKVTAKTTTPPEGGTCSVSISVQIIRAGGSFQFSISGFGHGERVRVILHSDPVVLGEFQANQDGVLQNVTVSIPADVPVGQHTIEVLGLTSGLSATTPLTVAASVPQADGQAPILPGAYDGLAATGVDGAQPVGALALGAIGAGVLAVVAGGWLLRRRRHGDHDVTGMTEEG
ncbi:GH92 family glycosyl hydrolase [Schumannella soli]|uniref:GH92 family glycosyl hydrolase n=1 Tax=Schumannella soli TaxID=2590779 RepID=UPI0021055F57|nr:GH92 family glycosyl hydrolase [Schumannella soli]